MRFLIIVIFAIFALNTQAQVSTTNVGGTTIKMFGNSITSLTELSEVTNQSLTTDSLFVTDYIEVNGSRLIILSELIIDDASITFPLATCGFGTVIIGNSQEYSSFYWKTDGSVTLVNNTANVVTTDTDNKLCIIDNGTGIIIKNRLGSNLNVTLNSTLCD